MVKKLIFILFIFTGFGLNAQELMLPELPEVDSLFLEPGEDFMYEPLISGGLFLDEMKRTVQAYQFDLAGELSKRWSFDVSEQITGFWQEGMFFNRPSGIVSSPFMRDGVVLSGASYKLNSRFSMGGYSFGGNSVFTAPFPNQGFNQFDVRGSTLFMQYNVSKKFRIETRINVTQGPGY
jgi:hypothetical protein